MIVRPVRSADLSALIDLARSTGTGLTTLPANEERLSHRVGWAEKTFLGEAERADADYLFVMEDDDGKVVGISAVAGAVENVASGRTLLGFGYRSAGWPVLDVLEAELLAAGLLERERGAFGCETLRVTDAGIAAISQKQISSNAVIIKILSSTTCHL